MNYTAREEVVLKQGTQEARQKRGNTSLFFAWHICREAQSVPPLRCKVCVVRTHVSSHLYSTSYVRQGTYNVPIFSPWCKWRLFQRPAREPALSNNISEREPRRVASADNGTKWTRPAERARALDHKTSSLCSRAALQRPPAPTTTRSPPFQRATMIRARFITKSLFRNNKPIRNQIITQTK